MYIEAICPRAPMYTLEKTDQVLIAIVEREVFPRIAWVRE